MLSDLIEKLTSDTSIIEEWKTLVSKDLKGFVKRTSPFKQLKVSGYYFYVDTKSLTYSVILSGSRPNAARSRAFGAPVNRREPAPKPRHVKIEDKWKTVMTQRTTSSRLGVKPLDIGYYGVNQKPTKYFGLTQYGKVRAFGVANDDKAVPIYSDTGLVEWVVDSNMAEVERILEEAGFKAINGGMK